MGRPKLAKNIPKKGILFRCKHGHIRCKGGEACEDAVAYTGKPTSWKAEFNVLILKYFRRESFKVCFDGNDRPHVVVADKFPTFEGFADEVCDTSVQTLYTWAKDENDNKYPGFRESWTRAHELQKRIYLENVNSGASAGGVVAMLGKNLFGFKDTTDLTNDGGRFEAPVIVDASGQPFKLGK